MALFSETLRIQAIRECIPLLSTYLQESRTGVSTYDVVPLGPVPHFDPEWVEFEATLRYLNMLGLLLDVMKNMEAITAQPSRVTQFETVEAIGQLRGHLDVKRWVEHHGIPYTPRRFPGRVLVEQLTVPENVLVMFIAQFMLAELKAMPFPSAKFRQSPFSRLVNEQTSRLDAMLHDTEWSGPITEGNRIWMLHRQGTHQPYVQLREQVSWRLRRRAIVNAAYPKVITLFDRLHESNISQAGVVQDSALLYDETFDNKLFEIWLLSTMTAVLSQAYGFSPAVLRPLYHRDQGPIFEFAVAGHSLKFYYQKSKNLIWGDVPARGNLSADWVRESTDETALGQFLHGYPDIVVTYDDAKTYAPIIIDAKNIEWDGRTVGPSISENIYKMVGYLDNFREFCAGAPAPQAILVFRRDKVNALPHPPGPLVAYSSVKRRAHVALFAASPASQRSGKESVEQLCRFILDRFGSLGLSLALAKEAQAATAKLSVAPPPVHDNCTEGSAEEEATATEFIRVVQTLLDQQMGALQLTKWAAHLESNHLGESWGKIPAQAQSFLCMGEYLFHEVEMIAAGDYAGAAIEYCRALETAVKELYLKRLVDYLNAHPAEKASVLGDGHDLARNLKSLIRFGHLEIGRIAFDIKKIPSSHPDSQLPPAMQVLRRFIKSVYPAASHGYIVDRMGPALADFATTRRNKVAHSGVIDSTFLVSCRQEILGIGNRQRLLLDVTEALFIP